MDSQERSMYIRERNQKIIDIFDAMPPITFSFWNEKEKRSVELTFSLRYTRTTSFTKWINFIANNMTLFQEQGNESIFSDLSYYHQYSLIRRELENQPGLEVFDMFGDGEIDLDELYNELTSPHRGRKIKRYIISQIESAFKDLKYVFREVRKGLY